MKYPTSYFKIAAMMALALSFVACGSKDNGGNHDVAVVPPAGVASCVGCTFSGDGIFMSSAYGSASFPMAMSIEVFGDANQIRNLLQQGAPPAKMYSGPAFLRQAAINVGANIFAGNCIMPPGKYQIVNSTQGSYTQGWFDMPNFDMIGPNGVHYLMAMRGSIIDANVDGTPDGFGAQLFVLQGASAYGPQIGPCSDGIGFTLAP